MSRFSQSGAYSSISNQGNRPRRSFKSRFGSSGGSRFGRGGGRYGKAKTLPISLFIQKATAVVEQEVYVPQHTFADFALSPDLKANITARGYVTPTPIQDQAIPVLLEGKDVIGIANTGTGKTAAFLLPLIDQALQDPTYRALIMAPTRELAEQIEAEFRQFTTGLRLRSVVCIGGMSIHGQIQRLRTRPQFVIGTPGRLKDLDQRRALRFGDYKAVVLDEVDRMLDMGFIHDMKYIISRLPAVRQSLFFSATMEDSMRGIMSEFLTEPVTISVKTASISTQVEQDIIKIAGRNKIDVLHELLKKEEYAKVLVFGRTKFGMDKLSRALEQRGVRAEAIHGNKSQNQRQRALHKFKTNIVTVLLATDVASRGIDISDVSHVINYDLPASYEDYVHRIGRTGRAGKTGVALTFVE